jgi:hypothetical protein
MLKQIALAAVLAVSTLAAAPAWATSKVEILNAPCSLTTGCLFSGNDNDAADIEAAYADAFGGAPLGLTSLYKFTPGGKMTSGEWNWAAGGVAYISVKAGNNFMFYQVDPTATSGFWTTAGLSDKFDKYGNEKLKDLSHYTLWAGAPGSAVPEPATWAMMIIGFGTAGGMIRSRRRNGMAAVA